MEGLGQLLNTVRRVQKSLNDDLEVEGVVLTMYDARLRLSDEQVYVNLPEYGNTSAASVPIALVEAKEKGLLKNGDKVVLVAFGAGLTWASAVLEWNDLK